MSENKDKTLDKVKEKEIASKEEKKIKKSLNESEEGEITLDEIKEQVDSEKEEESAGTLTQLCVFKLGDEDYALKIDQIKEVVLTPSIAKIPQTPNYIKGVANIRGNVIAIIDLEERFNLQKEEKEKNIKSGQYTLVVESESFKIGILVNNVPNTLRVGEKDIDKASTILQYSNLDDECIIGIVKSGKNMIIMLDIIKMMDSVDINNITSI